MYDKMTCDYIFENKYFLLFEIYYYIFSDKFELRGIELRRTNIYYFYSFLQFFMVFHHFDETEEVL